MINIELKCLFGDFNLDIKESFPSDKIIGLFGKSGCGKSRLLRQIIGFDLNYQKESKIQFKSQTWQDKLNNIFMLTESRGIGYLPQSIDLFPHLDVEKNILFSFKDRAIDNGFYEKVLNQLNIDTLLNRLPSQLSGGQKQRVGLARAILSAKTLLVLDEPLSAVGEDHKPKIMKLLKELSQNKQLPIIFTSHNRYEHAYLTEHLICMDNGDVVQSGDYAKISTDIKKEFAQEPDAVNHITATAVEFNDNYSLNELKTTYHSLWVGHREIEKNTLVNLELRAKDISISLNPIKDSSMLNSIETTLVGFFEVSHYQYLLKLKFEEHYLIAFITKKSFVDLSCKIDLTLYASFKTVNVISI